MLTLSAGRPSSRHAGVRVVGAVARRCERRERPHQVGPDETAGAENQDRALQPPDLLGDRGWGPSGRALGIASCPGWRESRGWRRGRDHTRGGGTSAIHTGPRDSPGPTGRRTAPGPGPTPAAATPGSGPLRRARHAPRQRAGAGNEPGRPGIPREAAGREAR